MLSTLSISDFFRKVTSIAQSFISFGHKVREINREKVQVKVQFFSPNLTIHPGFDKDYYLHLFRKKHVNTLPAARHKTLHMNFVQSILLQCNI